MMTFSPASSPRKSFTRFPWGAIQAGLEPNSFVTWANGYFGTNSPLDEVSSYTVSNNNFDGFTGNDISDVLASYSFAGNSAQRSFTGTVNASGLETDTVADWQPGDRLAVDPGLYSVAAVHQDGPDEVQIFLRSAIEPNLTLTGDEIVLQNLHGVSATGVASTLGAPIADGPVANSGTMYVGPSESPDLTSYLQSLWGPGSGAADDPHPTLVSVGALSPSSGGTLLDNNGDVSFLTPPGGASGAFTYTVQDEYGDTATGTVTVDTDPGPKAHTVRATVGHSEGGVNLTSQILAAVTPGARGDVDKIVAVRGMEGTAGKVSVNSDGMVIYTPPNTTPLNGEDRFRYETQNQYGQISSGVVNIYFDPGPKAGPVNATVTATGFGQDNLTPYILAQVKPGLSGDTETITGVNTGNTAGLVTLSNGTVDYVPTGTSPLAELTLLAEFKVVGSAIDTFGYTVTDQYNDSASGTVTLTLNPIIYNAPSGNGVTVNGTEPTEVINATGNNDTINTNGYNDVVNAAYGDNVQLGSSDAIVNLTHGNQVGSDGTVDGTSGWVDVTGGYSHNVVTLGDGQDQATFSGGYNSVTFGNGNDTVTLGSAGHDSVTLGSGTDTIYAGVNGVGYDQFVLNGSNAEVYLSGTKNAVFVNGGTDTLYDTPGVTGDKLVLDIQAASNVTVQGFSASLGVVLLPHDLIDGGLLGATPTASQVATYMNTHNGVLPFVSFSGELALVGDAGQLTAANFKIQ